MNKLLFVWEAAGEVKLLLSPGCQGSASQIPPSVHSTDWQGNNSCILSIYISQTSADMWFILSSTVCPWSFSLCSTMPTSVRWQQTASRCWWATLPTSWTAVVTQTYASCTASASSARIQPSWSRASTLHHKVFGTAQTSVYWKCLLS